MKSFKRAGLTLLAFLQITAGLACDLSSFTLDSVQALGSNKYKIDVSFCAGAGRNTSRRGADQDTRYFAFYVLGNSSLTIDAFAPATLTSPNTGDLLYGYNWIDNSGNTFTQDVPALFYADVNDLGKTWACIDAVCGQPHAVCGSVTIYTTGMPDSIWLRGMEGGGNIAGGCTDLFVYPGCNRTNLAANAGTDTEVFYGYSPAQCADLTGSASGGTGNYSYSWSSGATTSTATVCPTTQTTYTLTVTDNVTGCSRTDDVDVTVTDVRCGRKNNKVVLCKGSRTRCVRTSRVQTLLNRGATFGSCTAPAMPVDLETLPMVENGRMVVAPNPAVLGDELLLEVRLKSEALTKIEMFDVQGRQVKKIFEGNLLAEQDYEIGVETQELVGGLYYFSLTTTTGFTIVKRVIID